MTRQDIIQKWLFNGLALLLVTFLQTLVFSRVPLFGTVPVLLPLALVALATLEGPVSGVGFGIAVGILAMYVTSGGAWLVVAYSVGGFAVGLMARYVLRQDFVGHILCSALVLLVRLLFFVLTRLIMGVGGLGALLGVGISEFLWSMACAPLVYLIFRFVYRRWGSTYYA